VQFVRAVRRPSFDRGRHDSRRRRLQQQQQQQHLSVIDVTAATECWWYPIKRSVLGHRTAPLLSDSGLPCSAWARALGPIAVGGLRDRNSYAYISISAAVFIRFYSVGLPGDECTDSGVRK